MAKTARFPVILPSETQSREFDAKLLLAGYLAERGHPVYVGSRIEIHNRINTLPRGLYLAKDVRGSSRRMFRIMANLGFSIAAWDEEAIVFSDAKTYHERRVDTENLNRIKAFFALGADNRELIETAPGYRGTPIFETGNPRIDLLTPRCRRFFEAEVKALRAQFGDFILINSNFGQINHFLPSSAPTKLPGGRYINLGHNNPEWWEFRRSMFEAFKELLPTLAKSFSGRQIVLRPHPSEAHEVWREVASGHSNVTVVHEGSVHPWIMASAVAVHNGCTTGLESFLMGHPVIAYRPLVSEALDDLLPNHVSSHVFSTEELIATLRDFFAGTPLPPLAPELRRLAETRVSALNGELASERIDALIREYGDRWVAPAPSPLSRVSGHLNAVGRRMFKTANAYRPGHKNSRAYTAHRFPGLSEAEVRERLDRLARAMQRFSELRVSRVQPNIFRISSK